MRKRPYFPPTRNSILFITLILPILLLWQLQTTFKVEAKPLLQQDNRSDVTINNWPDLIIAGESPVWGDLNNDGLLDLVLRQEDFITLLFNQGSQQDGVPFFTVVPLEHPVGAYTYDIATADINNDGYGDISIATGEHLHNYLFINPGTDFTDAQKWEVETLPGIEGQFGISLAWGDMNGDGKLDLAIANDQRGSEEGSQIIPGSPNRLYLNESTTNTIKLTPILTETLNSKLHSINTAWVHVDDDERLDLVFVQGHRINGRWVGAVETVEICLNKTNRLTEPGFDCHTRDFSFAGVRDFAWANIDDDSYAEVAISTEFDGVYIYDNDGTLNNSDDTYLHVRQKLNVAHRAADVEWGDVDNDGDLDLLVVRSLNQTSRIYVNNNGRFSENDSWETADNTDANNGHFADIDNDGDLDLILAQPTRIYLNWGAVMPQQPQQTQAYKEQPEEPYPTAMSVAWGDMDNDGDLDLAIGNAYFCDFNKGVNTAIEYEIETLSYKPIYCLSYAMGKQVEYVWQPFTNTLYINENGRLQKDNTWQGQNRTTTNLAWGDVNGDGLLDLAVANRPAAGSSRDGENEIYLHRPGKDSGLEDVPSTFGQEGDITTKLAFADSDGDGDLDIAVANANAPDALYLNTDGQGNFAWDDSWQPGDGASLDLAWGDLDNDGRLDLAVIQKEGSLLIYQNGGVDGLGDQPVQTIPVADVQSLAWGDVDGDGDSDLAVGGYINAVYRNENGRFLPTPIWQSADSEERLTQIAWGDMNNDGFLDLVTANHDIAFASIGKENTIYLNQNGTLSRSPSWQTDEKSSTAGLALGDMDQDGLLDIAFGNGRHWPTSANYGQAEYIEIYQNQRPVLPLQKSDLTIAITQTGRANFYAQPAILDSGQIEIPYTLSHPEAINVRELRAMYSLNGGGQWFTAVPVSGTQTTNLKADGSTYTYQWDVFGSGLFGQADNVVVRLQAIPDMTPQPNTAVSNYSSAAVAAQTLPMRVRGTQVQVFDEAEGDVNEVEGAFVYRLPQNDQTAIVMGSQNSGVAFATDQNGFLGGRGELRVGDAIMATLPVTQTYRTPPQLYFADNQSGFNADFAPPPLTTLTAEFWVRPQSASGVLLDLDGQMVLDYATLTETAVTTATMNLAIGSEIITIDQAPIMDGGIHQIAISWDGGTDENNTILYVDGTPILTDTLAVEEEIDPFGVYFGESFNGTMDELRLWRDVRSAAEIAASYRQYNQMVADFWPTVYGENGALLSAADHADLFAYWPIGETEKDVWVDESGNEQTGFVWGDTAVVFKPHYTAYHTSTPVTETLAFQPVAEAGVQTLVVSKDNPLLLFDLDVSLEWDPRSEPAFLDEMKASFERASEILYDVTNGQVALRQVNFFYEKMFWGQSDIVIYADNSLRPSATIGGVVNQPIAETVYTIARAPTDPISKTVADAYVPGHIRMGTVWDPFGENSSDLGEEWSRALAHELSHYLLFMPDNYLGYKGENDDVLGIIDCQGSFMTNNIDPTYSEFLTRDKLWNPTPDADPCERTLADRTTRRTDWDTITHFYPMLKAPTSDATTPDGPAILPLNIIEAIGWTYDDDVDAQTPLATRNFTLRTSSSTGDERVRLPTAQVYLIKTQGTADLTDDLLLKLGTPTGGGDRIKVRGAANDDRICLFGTGGQLPTRYAGCDTLQRTAASLLVDPVTADWQPEIHVDTVNGRNISITLQLSDPIQDNIYVQVYPLHYLSLPGLAPIAALQTNDGSNYTQTLSLLLPAYEVAVRVWVGDADGLPDGSGREVITIYRLNPTEWGDTAVSLNLLLQLSTQATLDSATAGPINRPTGGPINRPTGGPINRPTGGPINRPTGGPINRPTGGPINRPTGGPINRPTGGPINRPTGGPINRPTGGPINRPTGGPINRPTGGASISSFAPILSADAQIAVYNSKGFFEDNGILSLQALPDVPNLPPWLVPVGVAYHLVNNPEMTDTRFISFNYLQRDVPEGFEDALKIFFLPDCPETEPDCEPSWQIVDTTQRFVENLIVAQLVTKPNSTIGQDGVYVVMATVEMPPLQPEWNLVSYPFMVPRSVTDTLASIAGQYGEVYTVQASTTVTEAIVRENIGSIYIRNAPGLESNTIGYLRRNEGATVLNEENGWLQIECPNFAAQSPECWITGHPAFVRIDEREGVSVPERFAPLAESSEIPTVFAPNGVYWIYMTVDQPNIWYLAPPIRQPDGTLGNP